MGSCCVLPMGRLRMSELTTLASYPQAQISSGSCLSSDVSSDSRRSVGRSGVCGAMQFSCRGRRPRPPPGTWAGRRPTCPCRPRCPRSPGTCQRTFVLRWCKDNVFSNLFQVKAEMHHQPASDWLFEWLTYPSKCQSRCTQYWKQHAILCSLEKRSLLWFFNLSNK